MTTLRQLQLRIGRQIRATDAQIEALLRRVDRLLSTTLEQVLGDLEIGESSAIDARQILQDLEQAMIRAGLGRELGRLQGVYADELELIEDEFRRTTGRQMPITGFDVENLQAIVDNEIDRAARNINTYLGDVRQQLLFSTLTGERPNFRRYADERQPRLVSNLQTEWNTTLATYHRSVNKQKADELGLKLFLYIGPNDKITRPFCNGLLRKDPPIYTADEIGRMDNGQGLPVFTAGGGYNCRHHWRPVSNDLAKELGYDGGDGSAAASRAVAEEA